MSDQNHNDDYEKFCSICHRSEKDAGRLIDMPNGMHICPDCMQRMMNAASSIDYEKLMRDLQSGHLPFPSDLENYLQSLFSQNGSSSQNGLQSGAGSAQNSTSNSTSSAQNDAAGSQSGTQSGAGRSQNSAQNDAAGSQSGTQSRAGSSQNGAQPQRASESEENGSSSEFMAPAHNGESSGKDTRDQGNDENHEDHEDGDDKEKKIHRPSISFINLNDLLGGMGGGPQPKVHKKKKTGPKPVFTADNIPAPHLLKAELDKYVIGQEHAKKVISVAAYNHYKRVKTGTMNDIEIEKSNILLIGPTGSGKTYLVKTLAALLDVPLAITDATSLTEAGYIGDDVESCISKLLAAADNDVDKAEKGIVFIDEIDKLAKKQNMNSRDVSGEAVQQGLLKLLEGSEVEVPVGASSKNAMVPTTIVDTTNILFIVGGAFPALEGIIKERLMKKTSIGFSAELKDKFENDNDILSKVTNDDLRAFGMIPEFLGRLPIVCTLSKLDEDMYVRILTEPKNAIIKQYQKLLALDDVDLEFTDGALRAIARKAAAKETGARALRSIIEDFMLEIMYEIPKDKNIGKVTITEDYVNGKGIPIIENRRVLPEISVPRLEQQGQQSGAV